MKKLYKQSRSNNNPHVGSILLLGMLTLFFVVYGIGIQRDIRGKAAGVPVLKESTTPMLSLDMLHPVLAGKLIDIGVFVNTAGIETAEADIVLSYDPKVLRIDENDIELLPEYRTINIDQPEPGKMTVNLFTSDSNPTQFVSSRADLPVAIFHFQPLSKEINTKVDLLFDRTKENTSGLYPPRSQAGGVVNILSSAHGATVTTK